MKIKDTRNPSLTRDVVKALGGLAEARPRLKDVAEHGADSGFPGFIYYSETCEFFRDNRQVILTMLEEDAEELDLTAEELVASFRGLEGFNRRDLSRAIRQALCGIKDDSPVQTQVENVLAWYALESVACEMTE